MSAIYLHDWKVGGEAQMLSDFGITKDALANAEVLVASYTLQDYSGSAYVLFRRDGKLYEVHGDHCSCHGLSTSNIMEEGPSQWEPEETTIEAVMHRVEHGWLDPGVKEAIIATMSEDSPSPPPVV